MKIYKEDWVVGEVPDRKLGTKVSIVDGDTFTVAAGVDNPCCLNFASHKRPGGGYLSVIDLKMPIKTQEEDLFRRSDLPVIMDNADVRKHYPLRGVNGIYCQCTVNKDARLDSIDEFVVGVVTVAAVVNPRLNEDDNLIRAKVERILDICVDNGHVNLVLGAWGCGVFNNDPEKIVKLFLEFLSGKFVGMFENVVFAIPGKNSFNYTVFEEQIEKYNRGL